jgi:hypothetical protein
MAFVEMTTPARVGEGARTLTLGGRANGVGVVWVKGVKAGGPAPQLSFVLLGLVGDNTWYERSEKIQKEGRNETHKR